MENQSQSDSQLAARLVDCLRSYASCAVAFSGGVDSAVVAKAAHLALGTAAVAVTGVGPAVSARELATAREVAQAIGIAHVEIDTRELERSGYRANRGDRCYFCKTELYDHASAYARSRDLAVVANGTNCDDLGDYRPGLQAADEQQVRSPLVECGFTKSDVRRVAALWGLSVADKPAAPCLASRVAIGVEVTAERLAAVEAAEAWLYSELGVADCRVRYHAGDLARIEVPVAALPRLVAGDVAGRLREFFRGLGFRHVTVDLAGLSPGSLNPTAASFLPASELSRIATSGNL
jgi:uncharacterized protein